VSAAFADALARAQALLAPLLAPAGLSVIDQDLVRPWGGFLVIDPQQIEGFIDAFFDAAELTRDASLALSPKILIVAPGQRLSWQYHRRRAEVWKVLEGPVGVCRGPGDEERTPEHFEAGEPLRLELGVRHRLVGLEDWGIVAEIWQHTDPAAPSDEDDIVGLVDDFGRSAAPR
jgi:mannose-6-phosphate isomerase